MYLSFCVQKKQPAFRKLLIGGYLSNKIDLSPFYTEANNITGLVIVFGIDLCSFLGEADPERRPAIAVNVDYFLVRIDSAVF